MYTFFAYRLTYTGLGSTCNRMQDGNSKGTMNLETFGCLLIDVLEVNILQMATAMVLKSIRLKQSIKNGTLSGLSLSFAQHNRNFFGS